MSDLHNRYNWLEIKARPKKDGLHDSGYRFIQITGVYYDDDKKEVRESLHQWSDHVMFQGFTNEYQGVNVDFAPDGTMRLMAWGKGCWESDDVEMFFSSAAFTFQRKWDSE